jgi:hypothetical protein
MAEAFSQKEPSKNTRTCFYISAERIRRFGWLLKLWVAEERRGNFLLRDDKEVTNTVCTTHCM